MKPDGKNTYSGRQLPDTVDEKTKIRHCSELALNYTNQGLTSRSLMTGSKP